MFELEKDLSIAESEQPIYVIYPDETGGAWRVQAVPKTPESFESRKALPEVWRGLRDDALSQASGVDGCIFIHASGFIGGMTCFLYKYLKLTHPIVHRKQNTGGSYAVGETRAWDVKRPLDIRYPLYTLRVLRRTQGPVPSDGYKCYLIGKPSASDSFCSGSSTLCLSYIPGFLQRTIRSERRAALSTYAENK